MFGDYIVIVFGDHQNFSTKLTIRSEKILQQNEIARLEMISEVILSVLLYSPFFFPFFLVLKELTVTEDSRIHRIVVVVVVEEAIRFYYDFIVKL